MAEKIYVICDGPPSSIEKHFVEVEDEDGKSVKAGEWAEHPLVVSYWRLGPFYAHEPASWAYADKLRAEAAEAKIARLIKAGELMAMANGAKDRVKAVDAWDDAKHSD